MSDASENIEVLDTELSVEAVDNSEDNLNNENTDVDTGSTLDDETTPSDIPEEGEDLAAKEAGPNPIEVQNAELLDQLRKMERENVDLRSKIPEVKAPVIPPVPDSFDPEYEEKMRARDGALRDLALYEARTAEEKRNQETLVQEQIASYQRFLSESTEKYRKNAVKQGLSLEEVDRVGTALVNTGSIGQDLALHLLQDELGPSIVKYLAGNASQAAKIGQMSPLAAAAYIERAIKPVVRKQGRRQKSTAPEPATSVRGSGPSVNDRSKKYGTVYQK